MSNKLILCQCCIHREVCGHEGVDDPALTFCDDYLPISGWISVKDRMPEMCRDVIGFCASKEPELFDGVIEIVYLKDTINFLGERKVTPYWCCDAREFFRTNYEVTHWMPLPEPPNCGAIMDGDNNGKDNSC